MKTILHLFFFFLFSFIQLKIDHLIAYEVQIKKISVPEYQLLLQELENLRKPVDFFENVLGITETQFLQLNKLERDSFINKDTNMLISQKTEQNFSADDFKLHQLKELRETANKNINGKGCTFNVIEGCVNPSNSWFRDKVDVGALQGNPDNKDAVFQVASNFNGLESIMNSEAGIMMYINPDNFAQGETAAVSAAPGLIYRNYFVPHYIDNNYFEVVDKADIIIVSQGVDGVLETKPDTIAYLNNLKKEFYIVRSNEAVNLYTKLSNENKKVALLLHSTC